MRIHTKSRVAIAAILDVAVHGTKGPVPLGATSERQNISVSYLEQLFQKLLQKGFVASYRGRGGGYQLKRELASISVADVIDAVDAETLASNPCTGTGPCHEADACISDGLWCRVNDQLQNYLRSVTLESVLADSRNAEGARASRSVAVPASFFANALPGNEERTAVAGA